MLSGVVEGDLIEPCGGIVGYTVPFPALGGFEEGGADEVFGELDVAQAYFIAEDGDQPRKFLSVQVLYDIGYHLNVR